MKSVAIAVMPRRILRDLRAGMPMTIRMSTSKFSYAA
jgi:hypothetical protein